MIATRESKPESKPPDRHEQCRHSCTTKVDYEGRFQTLTTTTSSSSAAAAHVQKDTAAEQAAFCSPAYLWKLWWRVDAVLADLFGLNKSKYQPYVDEAHRQHVRHQRKIQEENDAADAQVNDAETGQTAAASEQTTTLTDR